MDEQTWVKDHVTSQAGKTIVVTGANSGIGLEAAAILAGKGAQVIMACRNTGKAFSARDKILETYPDAIVEVLELNLSSMAAVHEFAIIIKERVEKLDVLINNAGVMAIPYQTTADGFEMQFGTNHLGHFALTAHLFPLLRKTPGSRIVNISSAMHWMGNINFENLNYENGGYNGWKAYSQSKLANMLFTFELQRRMQHNRLNMLAITAHPGYAATNLQQAGINHDQSTWKGWMVAAGNKLLAASPVLGALPTVYAATDKSLQGGEYVGPTRRFNTRGVPGKNNFSAKGKDAAVAKHLWEVSEKMTRISFPLQG